MAGVLTGNALGVLRVGIIAYLLGTHSRADSLAVAMGPIDTLNSVLTNSMIFAFVPLLTACSGAERIALFRKLGRGFLWVFGFITLALLAAAPWIMRVLAPGLTEPHDFESAVEHSADFVALHILRRQRGSLLGIALYRPALRAGSVLSGRAECLHHHRRAMPLENVGCVRFRGWLHDGRGGATPIAWLATRRQLQVDGRRLLCASAKCWPNPRSSWFMRPGWH